jgi:integrase
MRRKKMYYLRVRIPVDLLGLIGRKEIKQTLRTESHREARALARIKAAEVERAFSKLRLGRETMDDRRLKRLADKLLADILKKTECARKYGEELHEIPPDKLPEGYDFGQDTLIPGILVLDKVLSRDRTLKGIEAATAVLAARIDKLRMEVLLGKYSENTRNIAKRRAEIEGIPVPPKSWFLPPGPDLEYAEAGMVSTWAERPSPEFGAVCHLVANTLIDAYIIEMERINGRYGTDRQVAAETRLQQAAKSYTLNDLWESFRDRKMTEGKWTDTTLEKYEGFMVAVNRILGEDFDFSVCEDVDQVTELIGKLKKYKSSRTRKTWSDTSVNDCIIFLSTLHKYAIINRKFGIAYNPFIARQIIETDKKKREAFTPDELTKIWARLEEMKTAREIDKYWVVLLMMHTGARIGEVCQLRIDDLEKVGTHWIITFHDRPELGQTLKHAKRKRSRGVEPKRVVPVHTELRKLGFFNYVEDLKKRGEEKLFPAEKRANGRSGVLMAKKVKTFLSCIGKDTEKSAHCFRHTFITWFNQNCNLTGTEERLLKAMVGHEDSDKSFGPDITWDNYGGTNTVKQASDLLRKLDYGHTPISRAE